MATTDPALQPAATTTGRTINEFSIQVATVNGSGSQTANLILIRSLFQMGIPVSGKNLFPSNIAGLPTWYTIRANKHGYIARKKEIDFLVAMNAETAREDVLTLEPGAAVVYDEPLNLKALRADLAFYPVPFDKLVAAVCPDAKLRRLVRNMIYDGVLSYLLDIELGEMEKALTKQLAKKQKALALNMAALKAGFDYAEATFGQKASFGAERMNANAGKILIEGNQAAAIGCMMAGVTVVAWYPITPSSSLCESLIDLMRRHRIDKETGKATFAIVQAEDEIAAVGMVIGASWVGARAMTSTSGPGISLMGEFTGLGYYAEVPAVIFDIQRVGPSTGLPTRTAQGDLLSTAVLSHGDTRHPMLLPSSMSECYSMAMDAFDLSERLQTPVFVMSDLDLGMNIWMSEPFAYPEQPLDRGKVLDAASLARLGEWGRYKDVDGDGIPWRTLPDTDMPAYFTRGSGHNEKGQYSERGDDYQRNLDRLSKKFDTARTLVPKPDVEVDADARIGFIAFGSTHWAIVEGRDQLRHEAGLATSYLRLKAYPFTHGTAGVHRPARPRLRRRAEPRRADGGADADGTRPGPPCQGAQRAALQRSAHRRTQHQRCGAGTGGPGRGALRHRGRRRPARGGRGRRIVTTSTGAAPSPGKKLNRIGLEVSQYRGGKTTLCAGCGHNAISERIIEACFDLGVDAKKVLKLSGIGCSSKSPAYFLSQSHGFNSVHGRMPSVATGALLANKTMAAIGVSGDGDTGAIGIGQFVHLMRRNLPMVYIIEDNGCYGLTKGQFSPTADVGSTLKNGVVNDLPPIDTCILAIELGATFVARSFSGDKKQLSALLKAALSHKGTAMLDVLSPCVTFNDHEGSTKSYSYVKDHEEPLADVSFVPFFEDITIEHEEGTTREVALHDGSKIVLKKLDRDYDPTNKAEALKVLHETADQGEYATGLLFIDPTKKDFCTTLNLVDEPLASLPVERTRPSRAVLEQLMERQR